jgi:hypothetical protein
VRFGQQPGLPGRCIVKGKWKRRPNGRLFRNGYTSNIEVLDAKQSLFSAELSNVRTQGGLFQALINLYKAMGRGWIVAAEEMSLPADKRNGMPRIHDYVKMP